MSTGAPRNSVVEEAGPTGLQDELFFVGMWTSGGFYLVMIVAMLFSMMVYTTPLAMWEKITTPEIMYATRLSLISCTLTALLSLWVAVPLGYLMSRVKFRGKQLCDAILDVPIVLPPLVVGESEIKEAVAALNHVCEAFETERKAV